MNTVTSMQDLLDRKNGKPCPVCSHMHTPQVQCSRQAMASKITKLLEANSLIPGILQHNKEVTHLAENFRQLLKKADEAHGILMGVLSTHGEIGEKIKFEYLERLDKWGSEHISPDTTDQPDLFAQEQSTSDETKIKDFTKQPSGLVSANGSLL